MRKSLTATSAFQLLIQCACDAIDLREQAEESGFIQNWMTQDEGIASILALLVTTQYEEQFSPQIMTSLLMNYCRDEVTEGFVEFFCQLRKQGGKPTERAQLKKQQFDVSIDIRQFAITGKSLGWKQAWGPFREPYASDWRIGFAS